MIKISRNQYKINKENYKLISMFEKLKNCKESITKELNMLNVKFDERFLNELLENQEKAVWIKNLVGKEKLDLLLPLKVLVDTEKVRSKLGSKKPILVGGWATFFLAYAALGNQAFFTWRGTDDLDLIITDPSFFSVIDNLNHGKYKIRRRKSSSITNKYTVHIELLESNYLLTADIYYLPPGTSARELGSIALRAENLEEESVQIGEFRILNPIDLMELKLNAGRDRDIFDVDIILMSLAKILAEREIVQLIQDSHSAFRKEFKRFPLMEFVKKAERYFKKWQKFSSLKKSSKK